MKNEEYMTAKEVAAMLRLSLYTIYRYADNGVLPAIMFGSEKRRILRFHRPTVLEAMKLHGNKMYTPQFLNMNSK